MLVLEEWYATGRGGGARLPTPLGVSYRLRRDSSDDVDRRFSISKARTEDGVIGRCKSSGAIILSGIKLLVEEAGAAIEPLLFDEKLEPREGWP